MCAGPFGMRLLGIENKDVIARLIEAMNDKKYVSDSLAI